MISWIYPGIRTARRSSRARWTARSLSSSSRSTAEELVSKHSNTRTLKSGRIFEFPALVAAERRGDELVDVEHAVLDVHLDERPAWLGEDEAYRLSFTFRDASSVLGREHDFRTFDASNRWFRRTQRAWRPGQALVDVPVQEA